MNILGISAFYHDSAACLIRDGEIIAAAQEERFTRKKQDERFPVRSVKYCLQEASISINDIDLVAFYDKPLLKFERLLETYFAYAPHGIRSFIMAMHVWLKEKLWMPQVISRELGYKGKIIFPEHHMSHAASAFFPSPYRSAAILTVDGVGEWTTTSIAHGKDNKITILEEMHFPHSLGLLYSAFTYYTGFKVNSGEYKVMGLAPYGEPKYTKLILEKLIDLKEDGSFKLNMEYFDYAAGLTMTNEKFNVLFGGKPRVPETNLTQRELDLARSLQEVTEIVILKLAHRAKEITGENYLCLAGGVALNCVANGRILRENIFKDIWIQPAAGDAGGALGAALYTWHQYLEKPRVVKNGTDSQKGSYLGPAFDRNDIRKFLESIKAPFHFIESDSELYEKVSSILTEEKIVGWFQGRMEFGPRALGNRSILGDARSPEMQKQMNLKIKFREGFRPFAPSVLMNHVSEYFEIDRPSPYMLLTADVRKDKRHPVRAEDEGKWGIEKLNVLRSVIPAVTHVDYSARLETVHRDTNERYYDLINAFYKKTGCPVVVNTSFNVRGEPIVCTPEDAYRCFMRTHIDALVLGNFILYKNEQPDAKDPGNWKQEFQLD
ncbi:MAG: carbamoyltransferase [Candidatus Liptonbacteria bacterium]